MKSLIATFSITRTTSNGILEYLTCKGFRSENAMLLNDLTAERFTNEEGSVKVRQLRKDCRIKSLAKSIILNY
jgi:hypothetical protein